MDSRDLPVPTLDGGLLMAASAGPHDGRPVVLCHGTPGGRAFTVPDLGVLDRLGIRLVTYDRPGYGVSTPRPGRSVQDAVADVVQVSDALTLGRFAVLGFSGGGPHALAVAESLRDQVTRCATISSIAPMDAVGLDWFAGMSDGNVQEFDTALSGRASLARLVEPIAAARVDDVYAALASFRVELPVADQQALEDPGIAEVVAQSMADGLRPGADGWIDDDLAFCRPWGFAVDRVRVPTGVWHGTEDSLVPPAHASWLAAAVPAAEGHVLVGSWHFGPLRELESVLRWLTH